MPYIPTILSIQTTNSSLFFLGSAAWGDAFKYLSFKVHVFPNAYQNVVFVRLLAAQGHQKVAVLNFSGGFGSPLGFWGSSKSTKKLGRSSKTPLLEPTLFQDPFRSAPGYHFFRFLTDLGSFGDDFLYVLSVCLRHFGNSILRFPFFILGSAA